MHPSKVARQAQSGSQTSATSREIDERYGLEPVLEPCPVPSGIDAEQFVGIQCPHCGEPMDTLVDVSAGERTYIEDCEVCCRPIEMTIELADEGSLAHVRVRQAQ
jgi:Cysteine-rich CPXCG